jgi:hypothetical protein
MSRIKIQMKSHIDEAKWVAFEAKARVGFFVPFVETLTPAPLRCVGRLDTGLCSRQVTVTTTRDLCLLELDHRHDLASIVKAWKKAIDLGLEVDHRRLFGTSGLGNLDLRCAGCHDRQPHWDFPVTISMITVSPPGSESNPIVIL